MTGYQPIVIPFNYPGKLAEVVGFEPTDPFEPSVFKTAALSHAQPYFHKLVPQAGVEPVFKFLFLRETTLPICLPGQKKNSTASTMSSEWSHVWSGGWDLNSRFYGFAIRCNGPLCHRHMLNLRYFEFIVATLHYCRKKIHAHCDPRNINGWLNIAVHDFTRPY